MSHVHKVENGAPDNVRARCHFRAIKQACLTIGKTCERHDDHVVQEARCQARKGRFGPEKEKARKGVVIGDKHASHDRVDQFRSTQ